MRRTIWLIIASLVVGPAFGGLTFMACVGILDGKPSPGAVRSTANFLADYWPIIVTASYTLGAIPALVSALIMAFVTRWLPTRWQRLITASIVGGAVSVVVIGLFLLADGMNSVDDLTIALAIAASGAVAGFASLALVELFHPLPAPSMAA